MRDGNVMRENPFGRRHVLWGRNVLGDLEIVWISSRSFRV
jgi:hypothetical protein